MNGLYIYALPHWCLVSLLSLYTTVYSKYFLCGRIEKANELFKKGSSSSEA